MGVRKIDDSMWSAPMGHRTVKPKYHELWYFIRIMIFAAFILLISWLVTA